MYIGPQTNESNHQFNLPQAVVLSRWLTTFLAGAYNEKWLTAEGAFRLSGTNTNVDKILSDLSQDHHLLSTKYGRDDYISALKKVVNECKLIPASDPDILKLNADIDLAHIQSDQSIANASVAIQNFIDRLAASGDFNKLCLAEILYNYFNVLAVTERHHATNKMGANNLSIIVAPFIFNLLQLSNPNDVLKLQKICTPLIASDAFTSSFYEKYKEAVIDVYIKKLRQDRAHGAKIYENILAKKSLNDASLDTLQSKRQIVQAMLDNLEQSFEKHIIKKEEFKLKAQDLNKEIALLNDKINNEEKANSTLIQAIKREAFEIKLLENQINDLLKRIDAPAMAFMPLPTKVVTPEDDLSEVDSFPTSGSPLDVDSFETTPNSSRNSSPDRAKGLLFRAPHVISPFTVALNNAIEGDKNKVIRNVIEGLRSTHSTAQIGQLLFDHKHELNDAHQTELGDILSRPEEMNQELLQAYVQKFNFKDINFAQALKAFLETGFRLPGEGQKIDRMVNAFATHYFMSNQAQFPSNPKDEYKGADKVYGLAFATVMLNTDLHNPSQKTKMSEKEFIKNLKPWNIDKKLLKSIFDEIEGHEIKLPKAKL